MAQNSSTSASGAKPTPEDKALAQTAEMTEEEAKKHHEANQAASEHQQEGNPNY